MMKVGTKLMLGAAVLLLLGWQRHPLPRSLSGQRVNRRTYTSARMIVENNKGILNKH